MQLSRARLLLSLASLLCASAALAQDYPAKPIRMMTSGAGGGVDVVTRIIASDLGPVLGKPIVVENQGNPTLLAMSVAKAAPDGYTILSWGPGLWIAPLLEEQPYDTARDFAPIVTLTRSPNILVVSATLPVRNMAELIAYAQAHPGQLNYAAGANGSSGHIAGELFKAMTGTDIVKVAYKGGANAALSDLIAGTVHMSFGSGSAYAPGIKTGKLRAIAAGSAQRSSLFPDLPAMTETIPGFVSDSLLGLLAPAKTPEAIIRKLNQESNRVLEKSELRAKLVVPGMEAAGGTPAQFGDAINAEVSRVKSIASKISS